MKLPTELSDEALLALRQWAVDNPSPTGAPPFELESLHVSRPGYRIGMISADVIAALSDKAFIGETISDTVIRLMSRRH